MARRPGIFTKIFVFLMIFMWVFGDWPPMFGDLQTPFPIKEARASTVTVFASVTSSDSGGSGDWLGSNNAYADDVYTATCTGTTKNTWYGTLFGFDLSSIPDGSTINSVVVTAEWKNLTADTNGPVLLVDARSGGADKGESASDITGKVTFEIVNATPTGMTAATLKATGANGFWAIVRFRRTDNTAHVASLDYVKAYVDYTAPVAPTVTTQLPSDIGSTTSTGNGTITATGGANATRRGVAYMAGTAGDPTTSNSVAYEDGDWGAEAFAVPITGLTEGTGYRVRAYATNPAGTSYGTTFQIMTKPAPPTGVSASSNLTDRVTVTWTQSTGASNYRVYRDSTDASGLLGDVATYDDTGGAAPTITPGTTVASDGASTAQVSLSLSGTSANPGTTYSYTVVASNSTGTSLSASSADPGNRSVGSLTYQWQKSASTADADYSNIDGATASTYNDTNAPAPTVTPGTASATDGSANDKVVLSISGDTANVGEVRWYKCVLNATGASQQTSVSNDGYRSVESLTYLWYRSSGIGDSDFSSLGATTDPYDDTTAPAPTITPGTATASDGTSGAHVVLGVDSQGTTAGAVRYYYCAVSATGAATQDTNHDPGNRGVGALTYQWQRSLADSNADYSNIDGATTEDYNDTAAPANGDGRYYQCIENADGAAQQVSDYNRGYRAAVSISLDQTTFDYGAVTSGTGSSTLILFSGLGIIAANGAAIADFDIYGANSVGSGTGWTLAGNSTGNNYMHKFCNDTDNVCTSPPTNYVALSGTPQVLKNIVDPSATVAFQLEITPPTTPTDFSRQSATVTVQASIPD